LSTNQKNHVGKPKKFIVAILSLQEIKREDEESIKDEK
jgi:hypothetical protein